MAKEKISADLKASLVVFLVALPLCLGIALASGAPSFAGIIAGIVGGLIVGSLSGSNLSVSGPAAGLTVVVADSIKACQTYEAFLLAVVLSGVFQILLGLLRLGKWPTSFPSL
jgi:SulP family sulfate permease